MRQHHHAALARVSRRFAAVLGVSAFVAASGTAVTHARTQAPANARTSVRLAAGPVGPLQWTHTLTGQQPAMLEDVESQDGSTWAVGSSAKAGFADVRPLALRWQNGKWNVTSQPMTTNSMLTSVSVAGANDVWAVGEDRTDPSATKPLVMHWNGQTWAVVPGPAVPTGSFSDVQVASDGSVWVTGWAAVDGREHAVVYRYAGHDWELLSAGLEGAINGNTLAVVSKDDVWLGMYGGLAHFDGSRWVVVSDLPQDGVPTALEATGPDDVWLAGVDHGSGTPIGSSLLMHYDGTSWTRVAAPPGSTQLYDLELRGVRPVAVGERFTEGTLESRQLVLAYDGSEFVEATSPTDTAGTLTGAAVDGDRLWAVGRVFATPTEVAAFAAYTK